MPNQEILPPARDPTNVASRREIQLIDDSVSNLKGKINLLDRMRVGLRSGKKTSGSHLGHADGCPAGAARRRSTPRANDRARAQDADYRRISSRNCKLNETRR